MLYGRKEESKGPFETCYYLLFPTVVECQLDYRKSASDVLLNNGEVTVPLGRRVVIDPGRDLRIRVQPGDRCNVKVGHRSSISCEINEMVAMSQFKVAFVYM